MGCLKFAYTLASIILCAVYNPFLRCTFCRKQTPPGLAMLPFSFGVAIFTHYILHILLPRRPSTLTFLCKPPICLNIQNCLMYMWAGVDELLLHQLAKRSNSEEEILYYWWYGIFSIGMVVTILALYLTRCTRGHVCFDDKLQIKPWSYYWNRLIDKKVHFRKRASIIQPPDCNDF